MHVVIRRTGLAGPVAEAVRRTREHILPIVQAAPGFRGYCAFLAEAGDAALSISLFESRAAARETQARVLRRMAERLRDLMPEAPEVTAGETVFAEPVQGRAAGGAPPFVVVRAYEGIAGQTEAMHSTVSRHTLPAITGAPGFRGFYAFRDEERPGRAVSVTLFDTRADAMRSHEQVVAIMRERLGEMAYRPPRVVMGEAVLLAMA